MPIRYRNTDLDLQSTFDLTPLASAIQGGGAWVLHVTHGEDALWYCTVEPGDMYETPEESIAVLLGMIENLDPQAHELWRACTKREFNIGYDCGDEPRSFSNGLASETLARIATAGASLAITIYPAGDEP